MYRDSPGSLFRFVEKQRFGDTYISKPHRFIQIAITLLVWYKMTVNRPAVSSDII